MSKFSNLVFVPTIWKPGFSQVCKLVFEPSLQIWCLFQQFGNQVCSKFANLVFVPSLQPGVCSNFANLVFIPTIWKPGFFRIFKNERYNNTCKIFSDSVFFFVYNRSLVYIIKSLNLRGFFSASDTFLIYKRRRKVRFHLKVFTFLKQGGRAQSYFLCSDTSLHFLVKIPK